MSPARPLEEDLTKRQRYAETLTGIYKTNK